MGTIGTLNVLAMVPASAIGRVLYEANPAFPFILAIGFGVMVCIMIFLTVAEPKKNK